MNEINNISVSTPYTNRGVVNTLFNDNLSYLYGDYPINSQYIIIDWIQCTIFDNFNFTERDYFYLLFGIKPVDVLFDNKALFGYEYTYSYKNIKIFSSSNKNMGYHVYITGQGCRNIEELNINYYNLLKKLLSYNGKFTRIDISIDDFTNNYFTISKIKKYINKDLVRSKFKSTIQFIKTGINSPILDGNTIWFGSRSSKIMICFYDKLQERRNNNYLINSNIKYWTRCEIRFRDLKAHEVVSTLILKNNNINSYIKGILLNYVQFLVPNFNDSNKSRWNICSWWLDYCDNVDRINLQSLPYESSITKKDSWLSNIVSKSEFSVFISKLPNLTTDNLTSDFLYNLLIIGSSKIKESDLQFINEYRLKLGLNPFTMNDIDDFVRSIKDVLLVKNG